MSTMLDRLLEADAATTGMLLVGSEPVEVVTALAAGSPAQLAALTGPADKREVVVDSLLDRMHEYALADALHRCAGTLRLDVRAADGGIRRHGLVAERGQLKHLPDQPEAEPVDVVLEVDVEVLLGMLAGARNAGLDYLAGRIGIRGDADLALAFGGLFCVPGTDAVAVDPRALDPVDVAVAIADVSAAHLRGVMASGFRDVVLGEIFRRLPDYVEEHKAARTRLSIGFRLLGRADGGLDRYAVHVRDGETVTERLGDDGDGDGAGRGRKDRDATITCEAADFLRLATGHLGAVSGVLRGQLKVRGDKAKALQLASLLTIPQAP